MVSDKSKASISPKYIDCSPIFGRVTEPGDRVGLLNQSHLNGCEGSNPSPSSKSCGISLMVKPLPSKQMLRVRFPYSAPTLCKITTYRNPKNF
jgi:hypothetical protein